MANAPSGQQNFWAVIKIEGGRNVTQKKYDDFKKTLEKSLRAQFGGKGKLVFKTVVNKRVKFRVGLD